MSSRRALAETSHVRDASRPHHYSRHTRRNAATRRYPTIDAQQRTQFRVRRTLPISGRLCQQRTHLVAVLGRTISRLLSSPGSAAPLSQDVALQHRAAEVMKTKRSSSPNAAIDLAAARGAQYTSTSASSGAPIAPHCAPSPVHAPRHCAAAAPRPSRAPGAAATTWGSCAQ